MDNLIAKVRI